MPSSNIPVLSRFCLCKSYFSARNAASSLCHQLKFFQFQTHGAPILRHNGFYSRLTCSLSCLHPHLCLLPPCDYHSLPQYENFTLAPTSYQIENSLMKALAWILFYINFQHLGQCPCTNTDWKSLFSALVNDSVSEQTNRSWVTGMDGAVQ